MLMMLMTIPMMMVMVIVLTDDDGNGYSLKGLPKMQRFSGWLTHVHVRWSLTRMEPQGVPSAEK